MANLKPIDHKWTFSRQKGDHLIYKKPGALRPVVIPMYKEVPTFIILNNLRVAGISREKYFQLLKNDFRQKT